MFQLLCILAIGSTTVVGHPVATSVIGPVYSQHVGSSKGDYHYSATDVEGPNGAIKQQTTVGKDILGGHSIRHTSQATHVDPHSGSTAVKHDQHEFHINPYYGQAAVHTNNAEGTLLPHLGAAAFRQKTHDSKLSPGHTSIADAASSADVSPHANAASQDVHVESADVVLDGVAHTAHTSHRSYVEGPAIGGVRRSAVTDKKSFEGPGYGNLHYNRQAANQAYDPYGHASANEEGYHLNQAYDLRAGMGATNELEYSRRAARDPYGNYGEVSNTKHSARGGHLAPAAVYEPAPYVHAEPVAYAAYAPAKAVAYAAPAAYVHDDPYGPYYH